MKSDKIAGYLQYCALLPKAWQGAGSTSRFPQYIPTDLTQISGSGTNLCQFIHANATWKARLIESSRTPLPSSYGAGEQRGVTLFPLFHIRSQVTATLQCHHTHPLLSTHWCSLILYFYLFIAKGLGEDRLPWMQWQLSTQSATQVFIDIFKNYNYFKARSQIMLLDLK